MKKGTKAGQHAATTGKPGYTGATITIDLT